MNNERRRTELLEKSTQAERNVCRVLDALAIHYVRQYPIRTARKQFYADIYIPSLRLVIEVDGKYHYADKQKRLDSNRSACLRGKGVSVYRIKNADTYRAKSVIDLIKRYRKNHAI